MYPIVLEGFNFQYILTKGKRTDNILTFPLQATNPNSLVLARN